MREIQAGGVVDGSSSQVQVKITTKLYNNKPK